MSWLNRIRLLEARCMTATTPFPPSPCSFYTSILSQPLKSIKRRRFTSTTSTTFSTDNNTNNTNNNNNNNNNNCNIDSKFVHSVTFLPHPDKGEDGEDAYFVTENDKIAGVADGVGGWVEMGIDAGAFSRELMAGAKKFANDEDSLDPGAILASAYFSTTALGTCTACIVALDGDELRAINVGDSGFSILRRQINPSKDTEELNDDPPQWSLYFQTTEQTHFFNCPFQLGTNSRDSPSDGQQFNLPMQHGDLIFLATDGLIDNIFTAELIQVSFFSSLNSSTTWPSSSWFCFDNFSTHSITLLALFLDDSYI